MKPVERMLAACRGEAVDRPPVWFMRQAGRYLPEYRAVREKISFRALCATPEQALEVTLQPLRRFAVDGAIMFSDLLTPLDAFGSTFELHPGKGPIVDPPLRSRADLETLHELDLDVLAPVLELLGLLRKELDGDRAVLGFVGAPFTLASYLVEGGSSKTLDRLRRMLFEAPDLARDLFELLSRGLAAYAAAQVEAGAQVVQVFDSWGGFLSAADWRAFCLEPTRRIVRAIRAAGAPAIVYASPTPHLLEVLRETEADVIGLDWRCDVADARRRLGPDAAVQGNLDPRALFLPEEALRARVGAICDAAAATGPGHVFNLGHGCHPDTPIPALEAVVDALRRRSEAPR